MYCKSMRGSRPVRCQEWCQVFMLTVLAPGMAWAEPGVSRGFVPFLLTGILALALALAFMVVRWGHLIPALNTPVRRWVTAILLGIMFLVLAGPFLYVIGAIAITGRTM